MKKKTELKMIGYAMIIIAISQALQSYMIIKVIDHNQENAETNLNLLHDKIIDTTRRQKEDHDATIKLWLTNFDEKNYEQEQKKIYTQAHLEGCTETTTPRQTSIADHNILILEYAKGNRLLYKDGTSTCYEMGYETSCSLIICSKNPDQEIIEP